MLFGPLRSHQWQEITLNNGFFTAHFFLTYNVTRSGGGDVWSAWINISSACAVLCSETGTSARSVYDGVTLCFRVWFCEYSWDRKSIATSPWICIQLVVSQTFSSCENNKVHTAAFIRETRSIVSGTRLFHYNIRAWLNVLERSQINKVQTSTNIMNAVLFSLQ